MATYLQAGVSIGFPVSAITFRSDFFGAIEPADFSGWSIVVGAGVSLPIGGGGAVI
jgi:hypothetical protein